MTSTSVPHRVGMSTVVRMIAFVERKISEERRATLGMWIINQKHREHFPQHWRVSGLFPTSSSSDGRWMIASGFHLWWSSGKDQQENRAW